jgi:hypothetical protein
METERLIRLAHGSDEATWLTDGSATDGNALPPARAQRLLRDRFFGTDATARALRRLAHERALVAGGGAHADAQLWARLWADVERGRLQVRSIPGPLPSISPGVRLEPPVPPVPAAAPPEELEVDDRALMITQCAPELLTGEPLAYSYLIRGLPTATLRISSETFPGNVVHEAPIDSPGVQDGVHDAEWDGKVTTAGDQQDKRLRPRYSPAKLEVIHDDVYCDAATFTIAPLRVHAIDIEDVHFNFDRSILLPDLASVDGSVPTLDERRITGIGVIYAALVHAEQNPEQKILVVGHTDPSGPTSYNQTLSEKRAENVQLFLFGDRDGWRTKADAESHPDDVQTILAWQARRAGWDCDPGNITGTNNNATKKAIGRFQERYNVEVDRTANEGLDLPYRAKIGVDETVGPETWGAFFDVYMHELVRLLRVEGVSEVEQKIAALTQFDSLPKFIGCGEHIPFAAGRREPFADDDERERPQRNPTDRRVEILFFDNDEEPDLVCHSGPSCDPTNCPLYRTGEYRHIEIGVPRGLQIGEVVIDLCFEDPGGTIHKLPAGLEVTVEYDDGSTEVHTLEQNARLQFVTARNKSAFKLVFAPGEKLYLMLAPGEDGALVSELGDRDGAIAKVDDGGRFLKLPERFDTKDCEWRVPTDVTFVDGQFTELDNPDTQIGTRVAPAQVVLLPRWQHFRFEYFDRWRLARSTIPQPRPRSADTPPLVLEGHLAHVDYENGPAEPPQCEAVWDLDVDSSTLHCLPWIQKELPGESAPRAVPDGECLIRFVFPAATYLRTDGAPDAAAPTRTIETIASGHAHHEDVSKAGLQRLRYYDLPQEWWSRFYYARLHSEAATDCRHFQTITAPSKHDDPYVIGLDDIVLCLHKEIHSPFSPPRGVETDFEPIGGWTWEDDDEHRFTLWSATLATYKPAAGDTYFTDVTKLEPAPIGPVVIDHPPFCRLITRGTRAFDVFDARSVRNTIFENFPIGARVAPHWQDGHESPFFSFNPRYEAPRADEHAVSAFEVGEINTMVLRCCGQQDGRELFRVAQYAPAFFDFNPPAPIKGTAITPPVPAATALAEIRTSLLDVAKRWNGGDAVNGNRAIFEIGPADSLTAVGPFHALLVRGITGAIHHDYRIDIVAKVRAFMDTVCAWERGNMQVGSGGRFTAAHEWGHAFGNPDHYVETARNCSLWTDGIRDRFRSPGCPYNFDDKGMMNGRELKPRGYDMWHLALWMAEAGHSFAGETNIAVRQGPWRYTTTVTPRNQDRARFPVASRVARSVGTSGLCDLFIYAGGVDGFNGGDSLHGATVDQPWDLIVICRVKMAFTFNDSDQKSYNGGKLFLGEVEETIKRIFNRERKLLARGTYAGRSVRARILFSPRFISRTFPTGTGTARTDYLTDLPNSPTTAAAYTTEVNTLVTESPVHADIIAVEDPDDHGITSSTANPRTANLDTDDLEDETVEIFGKLIGLADPDDAEPNDYAPLVSALAPDFVHTSLEFVE